MMGIFQRTKNVEVNTEASKEQSPNEAIQQLHRNQAMAVEDVLAILKIPATFEIPAEVFMPEDLATVEFSIAVPHGYDEGQVMHFLQRARLSTKFFVDLLKQRNVDVARLASVVDRLQAEANNIRADHELDQTINIMPTASDDQLELQLMESRLREKRLEDELNSLRAVAGQPVVSQASYESLLDAMTKQKRQIEDLQDEVTRLQSSNTTTKEDQGEVLPIFANEEGALPEIPTGLLDSGPEVSNHVMGNRAPRSNFTLPPSPSTMGLSGGSIVAEKALSPEWDIPAPLDTNDDIELLAEKLRNPEG